MKFGIQVHHHTAVHFTKILTYFKIYDLKIVIRISSFKQVVITSAYLDFENMLRSRLKIDFWAKVVRLVHLF